MGRINTNVQSLIGRKVLANHNSELNTSLERLSTGLRINRGKDDPAGLIASESLKNEQRGIDEAVKNADRADQVANIAGGGLDEISGLLTELQTAVVQAANKSGQSSEERNAGQLQVDSILQTIDRLSSSTNFQGTKLLNGTFDFRLSAISAGVTDVRVSNAKYAGKTLDVNVDIVASAQQAGLFLSAGGSALNLNTGSSLVLDIGGSQGSRQLSFSSGTTLNQIRDAINTFTDVTGVQAVVSGTGVLIRSKDFGSNEFVSVKVTNAAGINSTTNGDSGTPARGIYNRQAQAFNSNNTTINTSFASGGNGVLDAGADVQALVNGTKATAVGTRINVNTDFLGFDATLSAGNAQTLGALGGSGSAFKIAGGGAEFSINSRVDIESKATLGIQNVASTNLGTSAVGYLNSLASGRANNIANGDTTAAQKIVSEAIRQVSTQRAQIGSFQKNILGSTQRALRVTGENSAAAQSSISDADFASETARLTRSQILVSSSTQVLQLANQAPQSALQLLG